jgi:monofunctional glycosyltransferase
MKVFIRKIWKWIKRIVIAFFAVSILSTIAFRFIPVPVTPLMVIRAVEQSVSGAFPSINKDWVSMNNISPHLVLAVIAAEDQKFTQHYGFDFEAIEKVLKQNERLKKEANLLKAAVLSVSNVPKMYFFFRSAVIYAKDLRSILLF